MTTHTRVSVEDKTAKSINMEKALFNIYYTLM